MKLWEEQEALRAEFRNALVRWRVLDESGESVGGAMVAKTEGGYVYVDDMDGFSRMSQRDIRFLTLED